MTPENIDDALRLTLEIEGLLLLMKQREESAPAETAQLLSEKINALAAFNCDDQEVIASAEFEEQEDADVPLSEPEPEPEPVTAMDSEAADEDAEREVEATELEVDEEASVTPSAEPVRLEDKIASHTAADLRRALTVNDRYLFCRELFDMNNNHLNRTLDMISTMESLDEAKEYIFYVLEFDPNNPSTDYFLQFIGKHFNR